MKKIIVLTLLCIAMAANAHAQQYSYSGQQNYYGQQSQNASGNVYEASQAMQQRQVNTAVVVDVRTVRIEGTAVGQYGGAAAGGALGAMLGGKMGQGNGKTASRILVGLAGAAVGAAAGNGLSGGLAQEVIFKTEDGRMLAITQADSQLQPGMRVYIIQDNWGKARLVPINAPM
jgi:outer membrane lipoprotein SlyB